MGDVAQASCGALAQPAEAVALLKTLVTKIG